MKATEIFRRHPECFDDETNTILKSDDDVFGFERLRFIRDAEESKTLNDKKEPCMIIAASGMCEAGRIVHHLANNIENPKNTILIVGYCSPETPGGALRAGAETIELFDEEKKVRADIVIMDSFSAHGDKNEMYDFIANQKPTVKRIFLVHGELDTQNAFKNFLMEKGFSNIEIPGKGSEFNL